MRLRIFMPVALGLAVAACMTGAGSQPILVGDHHYAPLSASVPVQVFMKDGDVHQSFEVVAYVTAMDLGKWQILTLQDALPALQDKARATGADAIIVDDYQPVKSGIIRTGYTVRARAVRLSANN